MSLINILIIASAVIIVLLLWVIVGMRYLRHLRSEIHLQWELVDDRLRKRHDLIPNLIETVRMYEKGQEELIKNFIEDRRLAVKEYSLGGKKVEYEHQLGATINKIIDLEKKNAELRQDTNFLELRKEIDDLENNIEEKTRKYNEMVRYYNKHRQLFLLLPLALIFRFEREDIFEVEF